MGTKNYEKFLEKNDPELLRSMRIDSAVYDYYVDRAFNKYQHLFEGKKKKGRKKTKITETITRTIEFEEDQD